MPQIGNIVLLNFPSVYCHNIGIGMKLAGFLLLLSGWSIVIAALLLLRGRALPPFVLAGFLTELLGLVVVVRAHLPKDNC